MDKRGLLGFFLLAALLLSVNMYFENRHQEEVKAWEARQRSQADNQSDNKADNKAEKQPTPQQQESPQFQVAAHKEKDGQRYYVLENGYQQLVFTSRGGALAEINLPQHDSDHPGSVVKTIDFDREMVKKFPSNAHFPSYPYFTSDAPHVEHAEGKVGGYYPLLRRDLLTGEKKSSHTLAPGFYATNIVSEYPELAELPYRVKEFTSQSITFEAVQPHRRITKTYSLGDSSLPYTFTLTIQVEGDSRGLWLTSGIPDVELISNAAAPALKYQITRQGSGEVKLLDLPTEVSTYSQIQADWLCDSNGFFGLILTPEGSMEGGFRSQYVSSEEAPSRLTLLERTEKFPGYMELIPLKGGTNGSKITLTVFAGPFTTELLKGMDTYYSTLIPGTHPDYLGIQSSQGWFDIISWPFAKFLFVIMNFFHFLTGSWGLAIILLTVAVRIMLYPLNAWSLRSSLKMQQIMPEVTAIQEKYKKDPKRLQTEMLNIYKERGVNPVSGCVPLLIQLPFLFGMFDLLKTTFELRGACFIPGWIDNLAAPDVAFSWSFSIPFIGNELHLLPILSGLVMFIQQRSMTGGTGAQDSEKEKQQKAMGTIFSVLFIVMFYHFPSGINIYWISTSLLGIVQQWWMRRQMVLAPAKR